MTGSEGTKPAYARLAPVYDWVFGAVLQPGRREAAARLRQLDGVDLLEVGVGTGINAALLPTTCAVTGIDVSRPMLTRAARRLACRGASRVRLVEMDAAELKFPDTSFDLVYAGYVVSAVPDPVAVLREMRRVCRPEGHIVLLNHFLSARPWLASAERALTWLTPALGFRTDLALAPLIDQVGLEVVSLEPVNVPPLWSLVVCRVPRPS